MNEPKAEYRRLSQTKSKIAKEKHQHITTPWRLLYYILYSFQRVYIYIRRREGYTYILKRRVENEQKKKNIYGIYDELSNEKKRDL